MTTIEYRVRPVTRYIVTRFEESDSGRTGGSSQHGEFDSADVAYEVGYALCKAEHDRLGWEPGDERIQYPKRSDEKALFAASKTDVYRIHGDAPWVNVAGGQTIG